MVVPANVVLILLTARRDRSLALIYPVVLALALASKMVWSNILVMKSGAKDEPNTQNEYESPSLLARLASL